MTAESATGIVYRNRRSDVPDHYLFFVAFVIGAIGIIALKELGYRQLIVTAFPLVLMGLYALYVIGSRRYQLREDRAGDNLYYLGFLYTLTSLGYSLWLFAEGEGGAEAIIQNFGIALATTIVGLALRVLLNQMREDPVEIEREARRELADAVGRLKSELDTCILEFNSFRRATTQSLAEGIEEIAAKANKAVEQSSGEFATAATDVLAKIDAAFSTFTNHSTKLNVISGQTATAMETLVARIAAIQAPQDLLERKFDGVISRLSQATNELAERVTSEAQSLNRFHGFIGAAAASAKSLQERIASLESQTTKFAEGLASEVTRTTESVSAFRASAEEVSRVLEATTRDQQHALAALAKAVEHDAQAVHSHRSKLTEDVEASRQKVAEVHDALVSMSSLIIEKLDDRRH
jgi:hypothetical protein